MFTNAGGTVDSSPAPLGRATTIGSRPQVDRGRRRVLPRTATSSTVGGDDLLPPPSAETSRTPDLQGERRILGKTGTGTLTLSGNDGCPAPPPSAPHAGGGVGRGAAGPTALAVNFGATSISNSVNARSARSPTGPRAAASCHRPSENATLLTIHAPTARRFRRVLRAGRSSRLTRLADADRRELQRQHRHDRRRSLAVQLRQRRAHDQRRLPDRQRVRPGRDGGRRNSLRHQWRRVASRQHAGRQRPPRREQHDHQRRRLERDGERLYRHRHFRPGNASPMSRRRILDRQVATRSIFLWYADSDGDHAPARPGTSASSASASAAAASAPRNVDDIQRRRRQHQRHLHRRQCRRLVLRAGDRHRLAPDGDGRAFHR